MDGKKDWMIAKIKEGDRETERNKHTVGVVAVSGYGEC